jgi:hypothetical protein
MQLGPQTFQAAKLQLFYCAFCTPNLLSDFTNAFFLRETHLDHPALLGGKRVHQPEQPGVMVDLLWTNCLLGKLARYRIAVLPRDKFPAVRNRVGCNTHEPCCERNSPPFETP